MFMALVPLDFFFLKDSGLCGRYRTTQGTMLNRSMTQFNKTLFICEL